MDDIKAGCFYFISNSFFSKVNDPFLKQNKDMTKRPHLAVKDKNTSLVWLVPCSSKVDKFETIIQRKRKSNRPTNTIKIITVQNAKTVLLFQDMFPVVPKYIQGQWLRGGQPVCIKKPDMINRLERTAKNTATSIRRGVKFTPTQPDANRIEKLMLEEIQLNKIKERITEQINPKRPPMKITR
jgi:hypothetical protein